MIGNFRCTVWNFYYYYDIDNRCEQSINQRAAPATKYAIIDYEIHDIQGNNN